MAQPTMGSLFSTIWRVMSNIASGSLIFSFTIQATLPGIMAVAVITSSMSSMTFCKDNSAE